jgi:SAM-dependent methyltransferase
VEPERLEERLKRLELERQEADRLYNDRLTAVDQSLLRLPEFPHAPPEYDESQLTPINEAWNILPQGPPSIDGSLKGRLKGFIWRMVGAPLVQQQQFNAALVDHLNRNVAAHRESQRAMATTIELIRAQTHSLVHFQAMLVQLLQSLTLYVDTKDRSVSGQIHVLNGAISALTDDWMKHWESMRARDVRRDAEHPLLRAAYEELSQRVALAQQTSMLLKREIERLAEQRPPAEVSQASVPADASHTSHSASAVAGASADRLRTASYVGFEDRFRGAEEEITSRLRDYVPLFAGASGPVVDLGCGRGELLQLFKDADIESRGVDITPAMVDVCRERGLSAEVGDAVSFLDRQPDSSLGGLIAIQVVEHLEPSYLARLIDVAFHKLRPGSTLVFETINPACWVAFFDSYIRDVTHRWPLHPETLHYMVQAAGFAQVDIQYRSPVAPEDKLARVSLPSAQPGHAPDTTTLDLIDAVNAHAEKLNARLFTFRDYAVVARR